MIMITAYFNPCDTLRPSWYEAGVSYSAMVGRHAGQDRKLASAPGATVGTYDGRRPRLHATTEQLPLQSKAVKAKLIPLPLCSLLNHEMKRYAGLFIEIIRY